MCVYVLLTDRVVKVATGATEKFAPRSTNRTATHVSGPFTSLRAAQRAAVAALGTTTCLSAQVASEAQVRDRHARRSSATWEQQDVLTRAVALLDAASPAHPAQPA